MSAGTPSLAFHEDPDFLRDGEDGWWASLETQPHLLDTGMRLRGWPQDTQANCLGGWRQLGQEVPASASRAKLRGDVGHL